MGRITYRGMDNMSLKVSVIMPSLNVEPYIRECMDSALGQKEQDIEIISIDAGSTDGTWEILQEYAKADERVRLFRSEVRSYGAQVNQGIRLAKGKYVAILETDDYVVPEMYGALYHLAEENQVDYVKADFDNFVSLSNGHKLYQRIKLLEEEPELYNKVILPEKYNVLFMRDFNLWKGIYRKSFLNDNHILLNESPGAAYQDIGFAELVLSHAKRAYYTDLSFYRYRLDREEASSNSVKGIWNVYQEFKRLLETESLSGQIGNKKGLYLHMATGFMGEYEKALRKLAYDCESEEISGAYIWLQNMLKQAIEKGIIDKNDLEEDLFVRLERSLYSRKNHALQLQLADREANKPLKVAAARAKERGAVIFGSGSYGIRTLKYLDRDHVRVKAFADNNEKLIGTKLIGFPVYSLKACLEAYPQELYVIASKYCFEEMKQQFLAEGGKEEQMEIINILD